MTMWQDVRIVASKPGNAIGNINRILPNIQGPGEGIRRILFTVAQSIFLYCAEIRERPMRRKVYRDMQVSRETVSTKALPIIAKTLPINPIVESLF